jgi:hypothetical protein
MTLEELRQKVDALEGDFKAAFAAKQPSLRTESARQRLRAVLKEYGSEVDKLITCIPLDEAIYHEKAAATITTLAREKFQSEAGRLAEAEERHRARAAEANAREELRREKTKREQAEKLVLDGDQAARELHSQIAGLIAARDREKVLHDDSEAKVSELAAKLKRSELARATIPAKEFDVLFHAVRCGPNASLLDGKTTFTCQIGELMTAAAGTVGALFEQRDASDAKVVRLERELAQAKEDLERKDRLIQGQAERIARQSELLGNKAEISRPDVTVPCPRPAGEQPAERTQYRSLADIDAARRASSPPAGPEKWAADTDGQARAVRGVHCFADGEAVVLVAGERAAGAAARRWDYSFKLVATSAPGIALGDTPVRRLKHATPVEFDRLGKALAASGFAVEDCTRSDS